MFLWLVRRWMVPEVSVRVFKRAEKGQENG